MDEIKSLIRAIPDFPKKGIEFRDLTTLFLDGPGFGRVVDMLAEKHAEEQFDMIAGVESRGFIIGAPLAVNMGKGFVTIRKPGKLPGDTVSVEYELEYGVDRLEVHKDSLEKGNRVLIVDDLLATGGTMEAACRLVEQIGGEIVGCSFVVELPDLKGRDKLTRYPVNSLIQFEGD
jgi:adenine phosphoribosyltransferase